MIAPAYSRRHGRELAPVALVLAACLALSGCLGVALTGLRGAGALSAARVGAAGLAARGAAVGAATRIGATAFGEAGTLRAGAGALTIETGSSIPTRYALATDVGKGLGTIERAFPRATVRDGSSRVLTTHVRTGNRTAHFDAEGKEIGYSMHDSGRIVHYEHVNGQPRYVGYDTLLEEGRVQHFDAQGNSIGETRLPVAQRISPSDAALALGFVTIGAGGGDERAARERLGRVVREENHPWCVKCNHYHPGAPLRCQEGPPMHSICGTRHYPDAPCPWNDQSLAAPTALATGSATGLAPSATASVVASSATVLAPGATASLVARPGQIIRGKGEAQLVGSAYEAALHGGMVRESIFAAPSGELTVVRETRTWNGNLFSNERLVFSAKGKFMRGEMRSFAADGRVTTAPVKAPAIEPCADLAPLSHGVLPGAKAGPVRLGGPGEYNVRERHWFTPDGRRVIVRETRTWQGDPIKVEFQTLSGEGAFIGVTRRTFHPDGRLDVKAVSTPIAEIRFVGE